MNKVLGTFALGAMLAMTVPAAAQASGGGGGVRANGVCSAASSSKIKLQMDDGGKIETEFEFDQNKVGRTWNVTISDNGVVVVRTTATTTAPSGSFTVRRLIPNRAGADHVVARAMNPASGESCVAKATI
jgi:hypothetical protein